MQASIDFGVDWIGYLGSACVLAAFCMKQMLRLRMAAIAGNVVFIGYAVAAGLTPVLCMNLLLLPLNVLRLREALRAYRPTRAQDHAVACAEEPGVPPVRRAVIQVRGARHCFAPLV